MMNYKTFIVLSVLILLVTGANVSSAPVSVESLLPRDRIPKGWTLVDGPKIYTRKTLFERIDGQAELFFKYGFQKSVFGMYQSQKKREHQIELDIYDMGSILQAFGIFSRSRNEDHPIGIGSDSYLHEGSCLFYQGKYFVMLYSTESDPSILKEFASDISARIGAISQPPREIGYFPENGLKPGSIQYFPEALLGHRFMGRGFQGTYKAKVEVKVKAEAGTKAKVEENVKAETETKAKVEVKAESDIRAKAEEEEFKLFLAIFKDPGHGKSALKAYKDYLSAKGRLDPEIPTALGLDALKGEDPYQGKIVVRLKGIYLLGAAGFQAAENGESHLKAFMKKVK